LSLLAEIAGGTSPLSRCFRFHSGTDLILRAMRRATSSSCRKIPARKKTIALKLCKQHQAVEESEVSSHRRLNFHTLINNCVENLIVQKYFSCSSAQLLPRSSFRILTGLIANDRVACRIP
jgi:hypothetical protein